MAAKKIVLDDNTLQKVETLAAQGLTDEQIASVFGCSRSTLARTKKANATFDTAIKRGRDKGVATITNALFQKAKAGDNTSMIYYLKTRDPKRWSERPKHINKDLAQVTDVELLEYLEKLRNETDRLLNT